MQKGYALVTGASSGIGMEIARQLAAKGYPLILVARRMERLEVLQKEITEAHQTPVVCLPLDLSQPGAAQNLFQDVMTRALDVEILVNNAGVGIQGSLTEMEPERIERMLLLNVHTLTFLTQLFAREMKKRKKGYILQVASMVAFIPTPYMATYAATKAYVKSFSEGLRFELRGSGVSVTTIYPGITPTEFNDVAGATAPPFMEISSISAAKVARVGLRTMFWRRRSVVPGSLNKVSHGFNALMPRRIITLIAGIMMKDANE